MIALLLMIYIIRGAVSSGSTLLFAAAESVVCLALSLSLSLILAQSAALNLAVSAAAVDPSQIMRKVLRHTRISPNQERVCRSQAPHRLSTRGRLPRTQVSGQLRAREGKMKRTLRNIETFRAVSSSPPNPRQHHLPLRLVTFSPNVERSNHIRLRWHNLQLV